MNSESPAFPVVEENFEGQYHKVIHGVLTKREYFAGLAMQGMLAWVDSNKITTAKGMAAFSVSMADALILELSKEEEGK